MYNTLNKKIACFFLMYCTNGVIYCYSKGISQSRLAYMYFHFQLFHTYFNYNLYLVYSFVILALIINVYRYQKIDQYADQ